MTSEIPLYERTGVPPARAGVAKPPYELADRPEVETGQILGKFSGAVLNKIIRSQAANEEAEARGQVDTLIESFGTFVADKPNASSEELQKEWDKISTQIKAIPGTLKTSIAKANFTNFLARNEGKINKRAQTSMEAIKSKQELSRFNAGRELDMTNLDVAGLTNRYEAQIESGLLDEETARIQLENDIATINIAKEKFLLKQASNAVLDIAQSFRDDKTGEIDLVAGQDYIKKSDLPTDAKLEALRDLNAWFTQEEKALEIQREEYRDKVADAIENKTANYSIIDAAPFDETEQWTWRDRMKKELESPEKIKTDWRIYDVLDSMVKEYQITPDPSLKQQILEATRKERFDNRAIAQPEYQKIKDALEKDLATEDAFWLKEARGLLDEAIRERDKLSGMLRTEEGLIARAAMAKMALDKAMDEAAAEGKPIRGREILTRAMQIVPMYKPEKKEEEEEWPLEEITIHWNEPGDVNDFRQKVQRIFNKYGEEEARAYYEEWITKFKEPE